MYIYVNYAVSANFEQEKVKINVNTFFVRRLKVLKILPRTCQSDLDLVSYRLTLTLT